MEPLEEARWALFQCRIGHPDRANLLDDVAYACMTRFERLGDPSLLEEAVELHREALDLRPSGHPDRPESLNVLGCALSTRYELFGDLESLSEAIKLIRQALDLLPTGHRDRSASLNNLALTLVTTFEQSGNLESLAEAIDLHRQALSDRPAGHSRRSLSLSNLAVALTIKFEHLGDLKLLAEAVDLHREALSLRPLGHPRRSATLNNLASAVRTQFDHSRDLGLLAEAVELHRQALDLRPPGHFERDSSLSNLGNALWSRFQEVGDLNSLTEAVGLHREALNLRPVGHSHHSTSLNNLAAALHTHFGHTHDLESLEEAIELNRRALHLRPAGHPDRPSSLNNLATMIRTRFEQLDDLNSLAEAVELHRQALDLRPPGHPERPWAFKNLADTLQRRFERLNGIRHGHASRFSDEQRALDLHEAIRLYRAGLSSCADDDPSRINLLFSIGKFLLRPERNVFDFEDGLRHILEALQSRDTSADDCLSYAVDTLRLVEASYDFACDHANTLGLGRHYYDEPVLQIYILVIQLLPRAASFGLDHARRLHKLSGADVISRNAATRAIVSGREAEAVEMLEEGRGVFWSQALRLRTTDLDLLPALDSQELRRLFQALDLGGARDDSMSAIQRERHVEERRRLSSAAEALITEIRSRPAMSRFLLPPAFFSLVQSLPEGGAFVILVASSLGHRALVLDRINAQTTSLELLPPGDGFLSEAVRVSLPRDGDSEEGLSVDATVSRLLGVSKKASRAQHKPFDQTLAQLWASIVKPVIGVLGLKKDVGLHRPRLWWCVTGEFSFLPIHAAGIHQDGNLESASDYFISSYIPTLSALATARKGWGSLPSAMVTGVLAGCATSPRQAPLFNVEREIEVTKVCFERAAAKILHLSSPNTAVQVLREALEGQSAHILHLACHGEQADSALESAFLLSDGKLAIHDLMTMRLPDAVLAFLSACQTARGSSLHPDQAVHLAASMLFCGFRSVVGTMWMMNDEDGPDIARWFYEGLFARKRLDLDDVAYALDGAVDKLRQKGVPASRWAAFIHIGG